ncbi:3-deoxy-D-manno-octulosonic acid transferase [Vibrio sp. RE86]|uniref:lipid IV(A) 3-deoxy-D-manno-octulosonic acid transferase n=1 Tax=Vibrio sp. RE86 TaxID=2607605 RepID=UPI00149337D4|nr:3-deoxy-D-manno-octulosonic acid transferase [Vibrio sp. RE86]
MIRLIYTCLLVLALPFLLPGLYKRKLGKPSVGKRWKEHFGVTPTLHNPSHKPIIWVHAVSVGEVIAISPLMRKLSEQHPNTKLLITTTTATGAQQASKLCDIVEHRYMPLDFPFAVKRFLKVIQPQQMIIVETELWANTLTCVSRLNIPITVVNARLSEKSFQGYKKIQPLFNLIAPCLHKVICQHEDDASRFQKLGVPQSKISVSGSIKYDISVLPEQFSKAEELRRELGNKRPIWIAASTHQGEDEKLLTAHSRILESLPSALLILVPRHPERFNDVMNLASAKFNTVRRTEPSRVDDNTQVYLADTMGEMMVLLGSCDVCFMGGSLLGDKVGGHNLLEPAALAKPTLIGPSYFNFADITKQLTSVGACKVVDSEQEIARVLVELFLNPEEMKMKGSAALDVVERNQGALDCTLNEIGKLKI